MISVKVPGGTANFPDGTSPDVMKAALRKKFPPPAAAAAAATPAPADENAGQGPTQAPSSLIQFPNGSGNTPTAASVVDMTAPTGAPAPTNVPPSSGPMTAQPPAAQPAPSAAPQAPPQQSSGNWLIDAGKAMASAVLDTVAPGAGLVSAGMNALAPEGQNQAVTALGNTASFLNNLGSSASFGVAPAIQRGIYNAVSPGSGEQLQQQIDATNNANPVGAAAGQVAAIPVDAMLTAPLGGIGAEGSVAANLLRGGGAVGNVARAAVAGGAGTAATELANGGSPEDAATAGAIGAVAGPIIGKVVGGAVGAMAPAAKKAWAYVASKMGVPADDVVKLVQAHAALNNGQLPSIQQVLDAHAAGAVKDFAEKNPQTAMLLQKGQAATEQELPAQATQIVQQAGIPKPTPKFLASVGRNDQSPQTLNDALDSTMDTEMGKLRDTPVTLSEDLRGDPDLNSALSGRYFRQIRKRLGNDELTVDDVSQIRKALNNVSQNGSDPFAQVRDEMMGEVGDQVPQLGEANKEYGTAARYIEGFGHGYGGNPAATASDKGLRRALASPEGAQGHAAGIATNMQTQASAGPASAANALGKLASAGSPQTEFTNAVGQGRGGFATQRAQAALDRAQSARASTPNAIKPTDDSANARNIIAGAGEASIGLHLSAAGRWARVASDFMRGTKFPPAVQRTIGQGLISHDPKVVGDTLETLRRAGVAAQDLKRLQNVASAAFGGAVGTTLAGTAEPQ